jgi:flagellum-specific ATP synthase
MLDVAIKKRDQINAFLQQDVDESAYMQACLQQLAQTVS